MKVVATGDGNRFVLNLNDSSSVPTYQPNRTFGLKLGEYILQNVPITHPIAILNMHNNGVS